MKRRAIFFDRDNTLIVNDGYLGDPAQVRLVEGAADAIARARELGFAVVVFSNQSGVARGMFDEDAVRAVNRRTEEMLLEQNPDAVIDHQEYCPFHPKAVVEQYRQDSELRKPKPGMLFRAAEALALDLSRSWAVGDAPRDIAAGKAAGCRTILFTDPTLPISPATSEGDDGPTPDYVVATLRGAIACIEAAVRSEAQDDDAIPPCDVKGSQPTGDAKPDESDHSTANGSAAADGSSNGFESRAAGQAGGFSTHPTASLTAINDSFGRRLSAAVDSLDRSGSAATITMSISPPPAETDPVPTIASAPATTLPITPAPDAAGPTRINAAIPVAPPTPTGGATTPADPQPIDLKHLEHVTEQLLIEVRRVREHGQSDFSVSKLLAGVVQVLALGAMILAYFFRGDPALQPILLTALTLQSLTTSLLLMGR
jgi:D-glycero-D-manno-heptose 1,7-bisphosphate phosphatase